jgi:hypothetical protein
MVDPTTEVPLMLIPAQSRSPLATGRIMFVVPVTGREERITSGGQDIGEIVTAREFGYTAITSYADTKPGSTREGMLPWLPGGDQSA